MGTLKWLDVALPHVWCCEGCHAPHTSEPSAGGDKHVHSAAELNENENCVSTVLQFQPSFLTLHASNWLSYV